MVISQRYCIIWQLSPDNLDFYDTYLHSSLQRISARKFLLGLKTNRCKSTVFNNFTAHSALVSMHWLSHLVRIPSVQSLHTWSIFSLKLRFLFTSNFSWQEIKRRTSTSQTRLIKNLPVISAPILMWQLSFVFALDGLQWKREIRCKCKLFQCQDAGRPILVWRHLEKKALLGDRFAVTKTSAKEVYWGL